MGGPASLNLIDVVSSKAHIRQYAGQTMDNVIEFLLDCRTKNAIPNYLQMDDGASFIGDLIHPRHFSRVVRLYLHLGVEPVFIAPSKPWMNGAIENFNGDFGAKLWEREQWTDLEHIRSEAKIFLMRHNNRQDWKYRKTDPELYCTANFRRISRSMRITCQSQRAKCTLYGRLRRTEQLAY